jgi:hypothetical protein
VVTRGRRSRNSHPFGHPPQRLFYGFECRTPLIVPPLAEPSGHRFLQAVSLRFQTGVPGNLPTSPQPVLQAVSEAVGRRASDT